MAFLCRGCQPARGGVTPATWRAIGAEPPGTAIPVASWGTNRWGRHDEQSGARPARPARDGTPRCCPAPGRRPGVGVARRPAGRRPRAGGLAGGPPAGRRGGPFADPAPPRPRRHDGAARVGDRRAVLARRCTPAASSASTPPRDASDPAWITSALAAELRAGSCPVADPATTPDPAQPRVAASLTTGELQVVGNFTKAAAEDLARSIQP